MRGVCWDPQRLGPPDDYEVIYGHPWPKSWLYSVQVEEVMGLDSAEVLTCGTCGRTFVLRKRAVDVLQI